MSLIAFVEFWAYRNHNLKYLKIFLSNFATWSLTSKATLVITSVLKSLVTLGTGITSALNCGRIWKCSLKKKADLNYELTGSFTVSYESWNYRNQEVSKWEVSLSRVRLGCWLEKAHGGCALVGDGLRTTCTGSQYWRLNLDGDQNRRTSRDDNQASDCSLSPFLF